MLAAAERDASIIFYMYIYIYIVLVRTVFFAEKGAHTDASNGCHVAAHSIYTHLKVANMLAYYYC